MNSCDVYSIQHYVIKFVSDLWQVGYSGLLHQQEEFEDNKGEIRIRISKKNRQHNGQNKKYKRTKGQTTIYKTYT